jgi:hypothetical protein
LLAKGIVELRVRINTNNPEWLRGQLDAPIAVSIIHHEVPTDSPERMSCGSLKEAKITICNPWPSFACH